ncbi:class I SAM-dependent methyltransferase [Phenylobacterium montanum]|uniref:Class I SAM-dependent methyltransferase n=1 Tax=Phenylobacterium montanum TaxID=2823693 RepID=A0A975G200_9CAUL|nr:class I SAM-dependent methyltransferase [Caulobacter sp. S6]QUD88526.1 class I SAM-dependent methyltransferase [Caulobacter sp. S6]
MVEQRFTFNAIAGDYDARRPGYPAALFEDLAAVAPGRRVLEVGCGTGKATQALAAGGWQVTALDPGPDMLAQAAARIGAGGDVRFVQGTFEAWAPDTDGFDLICAAQAWHWVDPAVGYAKAASLLAPGGVLAIFGNVDLPVPEPLRADFDTAFSAAFDRAPSNAPGAAYKPGGWLAQTFEASGMFGPLQHTAFAHAMEHDAESFPGLVATFSDVQMLAPEKRKRLLADLAQAIERFGGRFTQGLETHLHWATRRG